MCPQYGGVLISGVLISEVPLYMYYIYNHSPHIEPVQQLLQVELHCSNYSALRCDVITS